MTELTDLDLYGPTPQWMYDRYAQHLMNSQGITLDQAKAILDELWLASERHWDEQADAAN